MSIKIEPRGKFGGVKIHLDPEECNNLLEYAEPSEPHDGNLVFEASVAGQALALKMGRKIRALLKEQPNLLGERTQEEVIAILAKESEKAALQLAQLKAGGSITEKVDPEKLTTALLKHVK